MTTQKKLQAILLMLQQLNALVNSDEHKDLLKLYGRNKNAISAVINKKIRATQQYLENSSPWAEGFIDTIDSFVNGLFSVLITPTSVQHIPLAHLSLLHKIVKPCIFIPENEACLNLLDSFINSAQDECDFNHSEGFPFLYDDLVIPPHLDSYEAMIHYLIEYKNTIVARTDVFFEQLQHKSIAEQYNLLKEECFKIASEGNFYALYCMFNLLDSWPQTQLTQLLTLQDKNQKNLAQHLPYNHGCSFDERIYAFVLNRIFRLINKIPDTQRQAILDFKTKDEQTLRSRIFHHADVQTFCIYIQLLEDERDLEETGWRSINRQHELFEYLKKTIIQDKNTVLLSNALSPDTALHAFLVSEPPINWFYFMAPKLHPYMRELKKLGDTLLGQKTEFELPTFSIFYCPPEKLSIETACNKNRKGSSDELIGCKKD